MKYPIRKATRIKTAARALTRDERSQAANWLLCALLAAGLASACSDKTDKKETPIRTAMTQTETEAQMATPIHLWMGPTTIPTVLPVGTATGMAIRRIPEESLAVEMSTVVKEERQPVSLAER